MIPGSLEESPPGNVHPLRTRHHRRIHDQVQVQVQGASQLSAVPTLQADQVGDQDVGSL